nr:aminoacyl-tRNA synthetase, class 1a, anticodon-binding [Tanacetum cinerariifolium]
FKTLNYLTKKKTDLAAADEEEKMPSFSKGSHFRFVLCNVIPSTFNRNFDDPLVFTNSCSLSPQDISYCSLSVSTSVKITAKLYATTYKGCKICGTIHDYFKCFPVPSHVIEHPTTLAEWEEAKKIVYILNDALEISKGHAFINFSKYFANRPDGSCVRTISYTPRATSVESATATPMSSLYTVNRGNGESQMEV